MVSNFKINFKNCAFEDLKCRIDGVRLPNFTGVDDWTLGTPVEALKRVLEEWEEYDWKFQQDYLNSFPQFTCHVGGVDLHFFHIKSTIKDAPTILMAHGWPDSFLRYAKTFPLLNDFNLVVPSIPGFGFSTLPKNGWVNNAETAEIWHLLMNEVWGYKTYFATGGDMGRGALFFAKEEDLPVEYIEYRKNMLQWMQHDGAYINIQGSKPYSLGYGLSDSPAAMAGWVLEKFHDWSDWERFSSVDLLNNLTLYWMTGCASSSITAYYGNFVSLAPLGKITQPIGIAQFPHDILPAPRKWIEDNYNVVQFSEMPFGGHFTAMEAPEAFSDDLKKFIKILKL